MTGRASEEAEMLRRSSEGSYHHEEHARRASVDWDAGRTTASAPIPIKKPLSGFPTPNLALPTVDGYTVSHSLLVDNLPTDSYGFILDERFGVTIQAYRSFERQYAGKQERQVARWSALVPFVRGGLVVFPLDSEKVKKALRKGLPRELRPKAWYYYSGAQSRQEAEPKRYLELVKTAQTQANVPLCAQIDSDVSHTFANNRCFRMINVNVASPTSGGGGSGGAEEECRSYAALKRILLAVAYAFPAVSYTTGLNSIAAALLLVTQDEQRSFWILHCILDKLLPDNYYADMNLGCNVDQEVLAALIAWKLPAVHRKLQELEMSLHIVTSSWFMHLFVDQLPFETLLRVWDCFLHEGSKVLFRIALALFKLNQSAIMAISDPFELAAFVRNMPRRQLNVIELIDTAFNGIGGLSSAWLDEERAKVMPVWRAKHAVRRFSRVSPAYCQAPGGRLEQARPTCFAPVVIASGVATPQPSLRLALEDTMPMFERPEEIESCSSSVATNSTHTIT